jgi:protein gp37
MAGKTRIGWTDATLNIHKPHCKRISPGCDNCYSLRQADRWNGAGFFESGMPGIKLHRMLLPFLNADYLAALRIFLTSVSDPFDGRLTDGDHGIVWALMAADQVHIYQVLSKRHPVIRRVLTDPGFEDQIREGLERLAALVTSVKRLSPARVSALAAIEAAQARPQLLPLPNVLLGVSAEDRTFWQRRTRVLKQIPASGTFVSVEPMLDDLGQIDLSGIDWVIAGGESGPGFRPMELQWLESLVTQCLDSNVPVFVKQDAHFRNEQRGRIPESLWIQQHCALPGFPLAAAT